MEKHASGSVCMFDLEEELDSIINSKEFDEDIKSSFADKFYVLNEKAPNPFWVFSYSSFSIIRLAQMSEVIPLTKFDRSKNQIECFAQENIVKIPIEYITEMEWH